MRINCHRIELLTKLSDGRYQFQIGADPYRQTRPKNVRDRKLLTPPLNDSC